MSRHPSPLAARLRRELLQRPGFTRLPVCGACGRETEPRSFGREFCRPCEAERAAVSEAWEAERWAEANGGPIPIPTEPMFGSEEAGRPFLPSDDAEDLL